MLYFGNIFNGFAIDISNLGSHGFDRDCQGTIICQVYNYEKYSNRFYRRDFLDENR